MAIALGKDIGQVFSRFTHVTWHDLGFRWFFGRMV